MAERTGDPIEEMLPAYALNALDERERDVVERALEREPRYQAVLADYLAATAALAPVERSATVPLHVYEGVMREVWAPPAEAVGMATRVRPKFPMAFLGVAAAWIVAFVAVGTVEMLHAQRVGELEREMDTLAEENVRQEERLRRQAELATLAVQPGVQQASMVSVSAPEPPNHPPAGVVLTNADGQQVLWAVNLDQPEDGYVYRVWVNEVDGETYPVGEFTVDKDGQGYAAMWIEDPHQSPLWMTVRLEPEEVGPEPVGDRVLWGEIR